MGIDAGDVTWLQNLKVGAKTGCSEVQIKLLEEPLEQLCKSD